VSLILEALRKLEREKQTPARGVVVLGSAPAAAAGRGRPLLLFLLGLCLGGAALAALSWREAPGSRTSAALQVPQPLPPAAQPTPVPQPSPTLGAQAPRPAAATQAPETPAASTAPPSPAPLTLQAVSERDGRAVAIINDRLLREGDSIDGAKVVRIAREEVELEIGGRRVVLRF
jgi:hypothetical protein